jgi:hypothetical protein
MSKPQFRPITPLDVDDAALDRINDTLGVPTMVRPAPSLPQVKPKPAPRPQEKLTIELPGYLMDAMKLAAVKQRVSVRHLVMLALQAHGMTIEPEDLVPDARRRKPANP